VPVRNLVQSSAQQVDDVEGQLGREFCFLQARDGRGERIVEGAEVSEQAPRGEAEEMRGAEGGSDGERLGGAVDPLA
jgi:hypothetical protein